VIGLLDILRLGGLEDHSHLKLVRHQDQRVPIDEIRRQGWLDLYQAYQSEPRFKGADYIASFYGLPGTRAGFYGMYQVMGDHPGVEGPVPTDCPWIEYIVPGANVYYDLRLDERFSDLRDRLVIDWGPATRTWVQKASNKEVLEIRAPGRHLPPFDDYLEFSLTHDQLQHLFSNEEAHRDWRSRLSAVAGIYLVLAEPSGDLYVGSATGAEGIWGRWREYAATGHAGNKMLGELIARSPEFYPRLFRYSVLQILPPTMAREEVIRRESVYKVKLGSRATGLNTN
jgi:hypothetical protein